jgi:anti-anti-sigma factor
MPRPADASWFLAIDRGDDPAGGPTVLLLSGRLGTDGARGLAHAVDVEIAARNYNITLDLSGIDYVSSAGLAALSAAADALRQAGGTLSLTRLQEPVRLALSLSGPLEHVALLDADASP